MSKRFGNVAALVGLSVSLFAGACGNADAVDLNADQLNQESNGATTLYDDFRNGFSASGPTDKWGYFGFGPNFTVMIESNRCRVKDSALCQEE